MLSRTAEIGQKRASHTGYIERMTMKKFLLILFLSALVAPDAVACSCGLRTLDDFVDNADSIHIATLQQAKLVAGEYGKTWPLIEGVFKVRKTLKGETQATPMVLSTPASDSACGISMVVSATYLVFKTKGQSGVSACDGSTVFEDFQEDDVASKIRARLRNRGITHAKK
jgi:hypothetical protein